MGEVVSIRPDLRQEVARNKLFNDAVMWGVAFRQARIDFGTDRNPDMSSEEIQQLKIGTEERMELLDPELRLKAKQEVMDLIADYPLTKEENMDFETPSITTNEDLPTAQEAEQTAEVIEAGSQSKTEAKTYVNPKFGLGGVAMGINAVTPNAIFRTKGGK